MASRLTNRSKVGRVIAVLLVILSWFIPLPYYVYQPGSAEALQPIITVSGGHKDEKGSLMLTTVLTVPVKNVYYYAYGKLAPNGQLVPKENVDRGMSPEEYAKLLQHMMSSSQESAIVAAMRYLQKPVDIKYLGVMVTNVANYSKAKGILKVGDLIQKVDDQTMAKKEDLLEYLKGKKAGDKVKLQFKHDQEERTETIELVTLQDAYGNPAEPRRAGLGIEPDTEQRVENIVPVNFKTEDIGGPSAGTMFALEIISQLSPGDLTKGHKIAGTGTIDADGNVGQIGGIQHKIVAAEKQGAEIFFCPADIDPDHDTNTRDAQKKAAQIGTNMKIVPIKKLADAVNYLKNLP